MNDPHTLRPLLGATIHHLLDRLPWPQRDDPPPAARGPRNGAHPAAAAPSLSPALLTPRQHEVLRAIADERIRRDLLLGTLEPHLLNGHDVIWTLRALVIRGLVLLQPIGPPRLTTRGRRTVDSH